MSNDETGEKSWTNVRSKVEGKEWRIALSRERMEWTESISNAKFNMCHSHCFHVHLPIKVRESLATHAVHVCTRHFHVVNISYRRIQMQRYVCPRQRKRQNATIKISKELEFRRTPRPNDQCPSPTLPTSLAPVNLNTLPTAFTPSRNPLE